MGDTAGLKITVGADVSSAIASIGKLDDSLETLEKDLVRIEVAIDNALGAGRDTTALEASYEKVRAKIVALRAEAAKPIPPPIVPPIPAPNDTAFLNTISKQRIAFTDLGRVITGQGFSLRALSSNFALLGPGVTIAVAALYGLYEVLNKQTDAEKKADEAAKKLKETLLNLKSGGEVIAEATGSEAGNIARVQALAHAINDQTLSYGEQKNALNEIREINKAYFGEFTKQTATVKALSAAVNEYSNALIQEAIIKKQSEAIGDLTSKLLDQVRAEDKLRSARDQAQAAVDKQGPIQASSGNVASGGADILNNKALGDLDKASAALEKQKDAVFKLREQIAIYKGDLQNAVNEQGKFKPLKAPPKYADDLKSIIPILEQIKKIYDELAKPNKEPLFKQLSDSVNANDIKLIQTQIAEAIKKGATDGAKDPAVAKAYADLATALQAKLSHLQNPNLHSDVKGIVDVKAEDIDKVESKIEKALGGAKGLEIKVPIHLIADIENSTGFAEDDKKKIEKGFEKDPGLAKLFVKATANVQLSIEKLLIKESDLKNIKDIINKVIGSTVETGFKDVGIALGDALSGSKNPFQAAIREFTTVLGDGLIKIGETMIAASSVVIALKASLEDLFPNPAGGLVEGIAAVALGEVVKNVGVSAFATGGIVTGPTLGLVGEAGPEAIFPLSQLNRFIKDNTGNGSQTVNVVGMIRGRDLALVQARDSKLQNLTS